MNTLEAIQKRSSARAYKQQMLTDAQINALITAGLQSPTATNRQELHFTVIKAKNALLDEIEAEKNRARNLNPELPFYYNAPVVIIIGAEAGFKWSPIDAGIAVQSIALAAEELGLGSVIIGCIQDALRGEKKQYFNQALKFPENYEFQIAIAVGYKADKKTPHDYDAQKQVTHL